MDEQTPEQTHSAEYNRGWADGQASALDACQPVIDGLQAALAARSEPGAEGLREAAIALVEAVEAGVGRARLLRTASAVDSALARLAATPAADSPACGHAAKHHNDYGCFVGDCPCETAQRDIVHLTHATPAADTPALDVERAYLRGNDEGYRRGYAHALRFVVFDVDRLADLLTALHLRWDRMCGESHMPDAEWLAREYAALTDPDSAS